jgi:hypothetical protein
MDSTVTTPFPASPEPSPAETPAPDVAAPAAALGSLAGGDRCANCAAPLASDQRYCLDCGERHGEPRVPAMSGRPPLPPVAPPAGAPGGSRAPRGAGGSTALIAGVGTLLIALGVGVLIGHSAGSDQQAKNATPQIITVAGGGAVAGGAAVASSSTPAATGAAGAADAKTGKDKKPGSADKAKAVAKATPTPGAVVEKTKGKVVAVGQKGSGKGYKNGTFTGDFFGN